MPKTSVPAISACLLLAAVFASSTLVWVMMDRVPPNWDDARYLANSLTVYDALTHGGVAGCLTRLNSLFGFKAPLISALPAPFYLLFGRHWHAAYLVNIAAMALLFAALYRIARCWWNARAAVFAIAVAGTMPLLYGLARWYMVEYVLTALTAAAVCVLVESDWLKRDKHTLAFGAICGLGLLLKISFPLFILAPFLYVWIRTQRRARALVLAALPCLLLALPWYARHLGPTLRYALDSGYGTLAANYGTGPVWSVRAITMYLSHVAASGVSYYFFFLALLLSLWAVLRGQARLLVSRAATAAPLLFTWLLPFAILIFGVNKDVRFIAPLLPAVALVCAFLLDFTLPRGHAGTAAGALLLAFPIVQMFAVSFGIPYSASGGNYSRRFSRVPWPHDELLKLIAAKGNPRPGETQTLLVGVDRSTFNADNIELSAAALQLPFSVETTAHEQDLGILRQRLAQASFFLYKEGGEAESPAFNPYSGELARSVADDPRFREVPYARRLPDGGIARIYQNLGSGERSVEIPEEFAVDFGGMLALTGMSVSTIPDGTAVKFRWRCSRPPGRDYWSFTHLIDAGNRIVAQLDRRLPDDCGGEEMHLRLPSGVSSTGLRLRFGIYQPSTGERLHIGPLQGSASSKFSLTDRGTALLAPE
jgi:4-amino-4-deoxy-L-arabinose transferase-like glycosyltransferase